MPKRIFGLIFLGVILIGFGVFAGSFTPSPSSPGAGPNTLSDIYNQIASSTYTYLPHDFAPPSAPAGTFVTLADIWNIIPPFITLAEGDLASGFLPAGIYSTTTDLTVVEPNLTASNIATDISLFGVVGTCVAPITLSSPSGNFQDDEDLTANIANYSALKTYWYSWYKNEDLEATTLIDDGLVAYWPFDVDTLDYKQNYDASAYGNASQVSGEVGKAYNIAGDGGSIRLPWSWSSELNTLVGHGAGSLMGGPGATANTTGYTISLWFKLNQPINASETTEKMLFDSGGGGVSLHFNYPGQIGMSSYPGKLIFRTHYYPGDGGNHFYVFTNSDATGWGANVWHQVVATWDLTQTELYIDGVLQSTPVDVWEGYSSYTKHPEHTYNLPPEDWSGLTYFGVGANADGNFAIDGVVDELMIFDHAISETEVSQLYYGGLYGGNKLGADMTTVGDAWKVGVSANETGGNNWTPEISSAPVIITTTP